VVFNNPYVMGVLKPLKQAWFHFFFSWKISFLKYVVFNNYIERKRVKKIQSSSSVLWTLGTWSCASCHKEVAFHSLNHTIKRLLISSYFIKKKFADREISLWHCKQEKSNKTTTDSY
jgi:hypothetical protein